MQKLEFDLTFSPEYGKPFLLAPNISRLVAPNPSPFTFRGTNTYLIGTDQLAIIDPGPDDDQHYNAIIQAVNGRPVSHIFVSHTHNDHSPLSKKLKEHFNAKTVAQGPHKPARPYHQNEVNHFDASADLDFHPDIELVDGESVVGDGWTLKGIYTPGHAANHMAFALEDQNILFSADHVMGWATSVIAPPDGSMSDYMHSLNILLEREDQLYLPGHGDVISKPQQFVRGLKAHRKMRERAILERIKNGDRTIAEIVAKIYRDTDPRLHKGAALSVLAHLEDLVDRDIIITNGDPSLTNIYTIR